MRIYKIQGAENWYDMATVPKVDGEPILLACLDRRGSFDERKLEWVWGDEYYRVVVAFWRERYKNFYPYEAHDAMHKWKSGRNGKIKDADFWSPIPAAPTIIKCERQYEK